VELSGLPVVAVALLELVEMLLQSAEEPVELAQKATLREVLFVMPAVVAVATTQPQVPVDWVEVVAAAVLELPVQLI
jgi:hypothetical protein